jgi:hypothetical protein
MMQKSNIGVSVGLFAAALYFIGLIAVTPLVLAVGYVFVAEQDLWLKKAAMRALGIVIFFAILSTLLGLFNNSSSLVTEFVLLFKQSVNMADVNRVIRICQIVLTIIERLVLLTLGFKALRQSTIGLGPVDKVINGNM